MARTLIRTITSPASGPYVKYNIYCTPTRNGDNVTYKFEFEGKFVRDNGNDATSDESYLGTGNGAYLLLRIWLEGDLRTTVLFKEENETLKLINGTTKTVSASLTVNNPSGKALSCDFSSESGYFTSGTFHSAPSSTPAIESSAVDGIYYPVNGAWKSCEVYYPINGKWQKCKTYSAQNGAWKECRIR